MTSGPLLTGVEIEAKTINSLAKKPSLTFNLPPTKKMPFHLDFKNEEITRGMYLGWREKKKPVLSGHLDHHGGQFMPIVSNRFEIGGFIENKPVRFAVTMPGRAEAITHAYVSEANNLHLLKPGARFSRLKLKVRDQNSKRYQAGLFAVRIRVPREDAKPTQEPQHIVRVAILDEYGSMNEAVDLSKGATAEVFVRPRFAGYFGPAQKNLRVLTIAPTRPDSDVDLGVARVTVPGNRFSGVVIDEKGRPVSAARVALLTRIHRNGNRRAPTTWLKESKSTNFVTTDSEGRFTLIAGAYYPNQLEFAVRARGNGRTSEPRQVQVSRDDLKLVLDQAEVKEEKPEK